MVCSPSLILETLAMAQNKYGVIPMRWEVSSDIRNAWGSACLSIACSFMGCRARIDHDLPIGTIHLVAQDGRILSAIENIGVKPPARKELDTNV